MMFKQFIEMGMEDKEAVRLESAIERFDSSASFSSTVVTSSAKKTIKKNENEEDEFNPVLFTIEAVAVVTMLGLLFYGLYFTMPAWMVI